MSRRKQVLKRQLDILFKKVINKKKLILIAYEPIWAIGKNNKAASIDYCNETMQYIRKIVSKKINKTKILYGGSVDEKNYKEFLKSDYIDGIFIGRAALNANNFIKICRGI